MQGSHSSRSYGPEQFARRHGLKLDCVEADMQDLSALPQGSFDLVYQPVSSLYVPDIRQCYREVAGVAKPGGLFFSEHWNPVQMQLAEDQRWIPRITPRRDTEQLTWATSSRYPRSWANSWPRNSSKNHPR
ncbi:MAG TPA: methyltransferase domain-containing protein [Streptosporangiaceae bacterium]|nr:methyltransferase domain-containing protein [Streptosporangiaceae bacterium]